MTQKCVCQFTVEYSSLKFFTKVLVTGCLVGSAGITRLHLSSTKTPLKKNFNSKDVFCFKSIWLVNLKSVRWFGFSALTNCGQLYSGSFKGGTCPRRGLPSPSRKYHPFFICQAQEAGKQGNNSRSGWKRTSRPVFLLQFLLQSARLPARGAKHLMRVKFIPGKQQDVVLPTEIHFRQMWQV